MIGIVPMQKGEPMSDCMTFPDTVEEYMEQYKVVDTDGIYMSKVAELFPIFRMRQWFEHLPSAQPEPQWIPCSEPPKESGTYIVTAYDGTDKRVTFVKFQKTLKRWDLTGARAYWRILAYKPLPEPWRGEENEASGYIQGS